MEGLDARIARLGLQGRCCTQIMVQIALEDGAQENPQMVEAVGALCLGLYSGDCCGALAGGALAMALRAERTLDNALVTELVDWFRHAYGSTTCDALLAGDPVARITRCPQIVEETYRHGMETLSTHGYLSP